ncbi:MAG TPA: patatin-like phospholipase family protein [Longimicrobiales bacterium]|nr:patatin-like phospholipase family protein [Longimicrobiales bacterium]
MRSFGSPEGACRGLWLVLGGGGLKGLAHVGAWRALREAGIRPEGIVGTSIGALVGALVASGVDVEELYRLALGLRRERVARFNRRAVWINGIRQPSVLEGEPLRELIAELLPQGGWSALRMPVLMNAVDLGDGKTHWFGSGARTDVPLADAVYASCALPVLYPPFQVDGRALVDGGLARQLPIGEAAGRGATRIVAIDVGSGGRVDAREVLEGGLVAIHQRVVSLMTWQRRHDMLGRWSGPPLLYVRPELDGYGTFDFEHVGYFLDEGYRAMTEALRAGAWRGNLGEAG